MYLFYVDETGNLDPEVECIRKDGSKREKDWIYVLTAFGIFEHKWKRFYHTITNKKRELLERINRRVNVRLELAETEIKSNWIRIDKERESHNFLSRLTNDEIYALIKVYYDQLQRIHFTFFSVIIDKRYLEDYIDRHKLHRKAWELLCERIENFMYEKHNKHKAILITDDINKKDGLKVFPEKSPLKEFADTLP